MRKKISVQDVMFGKRLKYIRKLKRISSKTLGADIGVSHQQILKYECGLDRLSCGRLFQMARALEVGFQDMIPPELDSIRKLEI